MCNMHAFRRDLGLHVEREARGEIGPPAFSLTKEALCVCIQTAGGNFVGFIQEEDGAGNRADCVVGPILTVVL